MPLHLHHFPAIKSSHFLHLPPSIRVHAFSASAFCLAASHRQTYYEILEVPVTATAAEIKKKFYSLSLRHHPDRNQKDPKASGKFASISSAYQVLGNTTKRARYDRDNNIHRAPDPHIHHHNHRPGHSHHHTHPAHHHGSFSSSSASSYAGSRPASGLSKRRGPFRGPPPSFYAHGGHGPNRSNSGSGSETSSSTSTSNNNNNSHDSHPSFLNANPAPHFNAHSHFRTQSHEDARRISRRNRAIEAERERRREMGDDVDEGGSHLVRFLVVGGMLTFAGMVVSVLRGVSEAGTPEPRIGSRSGSVSREEKRKKVG